MSDSQQQECPDKEPTPEMMEDCSESEQTHTKDEHVPDKITGSDPPASDEKDTEKQVAESQNQEMPVAETKNTDDTYSEDHVIDATQEVEQDENGKNEIPAKPVSKSPNTETCAPSDIPASVAEVAIREMQQFERINASNPPSATSVVITPKLSTSGLGLLASQYDSGSDDDETDSSSSSDDESDSEASVQEVPPAPTNVGSYRTGVIEIDSDCEDDSSSDSDVEIVERAKELEKIIDADMGEDEDLTGSKSRGPIRAKGEFLLDDLPPIQDLYITVPETECVVLGKVHSIVEQLILVDSVPGTAPLNLETILFLDKGARVLGEVFDVLGQVSEPLYCVRFNSADQIKERGIEVGQTVYIAPRTEHTHFVILKDMMQLRGSDASWENDIEPSEKHLDYSDDEEERMARRAMRNRDRGGEETDASKRQRPAPSPSPQQEQPRQRFSQPRYQNQRPPFRYRAQQPADGQNRNYHPNYMRQQMPAGQFSTPFAYGPSNASWHANYNQPMGPPSYQNGPPAYPNPYNPHYQQRMPFMPPPNTMPETMYEQPPPPQ